MRNTQKTHGDKKKCTLKDGPVCHMLEAQHTHSASMYDLIDEPTLKA